MLKTEDDEKESLTDKRKPNDEYLDILGIKAEKEKKKKRKKKKNKKNKNKEELKEDIEDDKESKRKNHNTENLYNIMGRYNLIKMIGFGSFGEIHLAYDNQLRMLCAIKFEATNQKNPQLKHEYNILEQLNKIEANQSNNVIQEGVPRVFNFEQIEGKCNFLVMEFLGPSIADLFLFKNKKFSLTTVYILGLMMIQRIEFIHERGFIHRDIKPENFVIGLNDKSNNLYIIDFGLSKRYKDKNTGQHIPYRENRHLVGTARYASINAHLGIEQSRRDDIESIGYVLVYLAFGRLPWQNKNEKGKKTNKTLEKKLLTPPEVLCKNLPDQFSYYFHYCKNLKYEDRPDYGTLKALFYDLVTNNSLNLNYEYMFDWFKTDEDEASKHKYELNNTPKPNKFEETPNMPSKKLKQKESVKKIVKTNSINSASRDLLSQHKTNDFATNFKSDRLSRLGTEKSKEKKKNKSFSDSVSESEDSFEEEIIDKVKNNVNKKNSSEQIGEFESHFNLLDKSNSKNSYDKKEYIPNCIEEEIKFKNSNKSSSSKADGDIVLNIKK